MSGNGWWWLYPGQVGSCEALSQPLILCPAANSSWSPEDTDRLCVLLLSSAKPIHVIVAELCLPFMQRCDSSSLFLITALHQSLLFTQITLVLCCTDNGHVFNLSILNTNICFYSLLSFAWFVIFTVSRILHISLIIHCSVSSWNEMLGCDITQEETVQKQVAWAMTDTESDSATLCIMFSCQKLRIHQNGSWDATVVF